MKTIKKICFSLFLLISFLYLFIIITPKIVKNFYPFGIKTAIVLTGSMEPTLKVNDFVIVKKPKDIALGDIISFKQKNSNIEVLHRVVKIDKEQIITKGDANNKEDDPIKKEDVTGIYIEKIKFIGSIVSFITKPYIFSIIITSLLVLMIIPERNSSSESR